MKVVIAEAATAIGYKKSLVTFKVKPKVAMIKENSPIWAKLIPACTDVFKGWPDSNEPNPAKINLPKIMQVDINKSRELLGWVPPVSVDEALRRTAEHFLAQQK